MYSVLLPDRGARDSAFAQPNWPRVHTELARVGVTLKPLHQEYAAPFSAPNLSRRTGASGSAPVSMRRRSWTETSET